MSHRFHLTWQVTHADASLTTPNQFLSVSFCSLQHLVVCDTYVWAIRYALAPSLAIAAPLDAHPVAV